MKSPDGTAVAHAGSFNFPSMLMVPVKRVARITRTAGVGVDDFGEEVGGVPGCPGYVGFWAARDLAAARTASAARHRDARLIVMEGKRVDVAGDPLSPLPELDSATAVTVGHPPTSDSNTAPLLLRRRGRDFVRGRSGPYGAGAL